MPTKQDFQPRVRRTRCLTLLAVAALCLKVLATAGVAAENDAPAVLEIEGKVEVSRARSQLWDPAYTNQVLAAGDRVRTGERSRAVVRLSALTTARLNEKAILQVPETPGVRSPFKFLRGFFYFYHRDRAGEIPVETPSTYAVIIGTEFHLDVAEDETTTLQLIDGAVTLTNAAGALALASGEAARVQPGQAPQRTAALDAVNRVQWCLYYPAVLDLEDLKLTAADRQALAASLAAYASGDLLEALAKYPEGRQGVSDPEKVYLAALLLAVGQVERAESLLPAVAEARALGRVARLAGALRTLIAAVKFRPGDPGNGSARPSVPGADGAEGLESSNATTLLAESYAAQAKAELGAALEKARRATAVSPTFGFAWARVAELEFSFGRTSESLAALEQALRLSPRHAQGIALRGFLLSAQNRVRDALPLFDEAIAIDGALGNAWLGRGLCRIRLGQREAGRQDLQVAATLEPHRAMPRFYLAKAFANADDTRRARHEIDLARRLDSSDPTGWLYSALLNQQQNHVNQAVRDLERSQELNENRAVYRSRLLLDQDRAVRSANLSSVYDDAGMSDVSAREASRAVEADYANHSAHLFLGNSYQRLRDPGLVNQRYETAAVTEYLLADLLAPPGGGTLAQTVSQHEYSKLFESEGLGVASATAYFSNGDWQESGVQYGTFGGTSYAVAGFYQSLNGWRPNNELEQVELSLQLKQQITPQDSLYVRVIGHEIEAGDRLQRWDQGTANRTLRVEEEQKPILLAGHHHQWTPGLHTLFLGGWLDSEQTVANRQQATLVLGRDATGLITDVLPIGIEQRYRNEFEMWTAELQQIWQQGQHTVIAGGRYQGGDFHTRSHQTNATFPFPFLFPTDTQELDTDFERWSLYGYYRWQVVEPVLLTVGLSYDHVTFPENFRYAPVASGQDSDHQLSPKGGVIWSLTRDTILRAGYSQSLGGVAFDQSFRIEPAQVAGLNQAFRSIIPESVAGANSAAKFETWGVLLEQNLPLGTYLAAGGEWLRSDVDRLVGAFDFVPFTITRAQTREKLDYREQSFLVTANQLVGDQWAFGARYRLSQAILEDNFADVPDSALTAGGFRPRTETESVLHQVVFSAQFNHGSGFFARGESIWNAQSNHGYQPDRPGDDFWQFNLLGGYRFWQRRVEAWVGVLNLTDQDYRLNPLNLTTELPRERTLVTGLKLSF